MLKVAESPRDAIGRIKTLKENTVTMNQLNWCVSASVWECVSELRCGCLPACLPATVHVYIIHVKFCQPCDTYKLKGKE